MGGGSDEEVPESSKDIYISTVGLRSKRNNMGKREIINVQGSSSVDLHDRIRKAYQ